MGLQDLELLLIFIIVLLIGISLYAIRLHWGLRSAQRALNRFTVVQVYTPFDHTEADSNTGLLFVSTVIVAFIGLLLIFS